MTRPPTILETETTFVSSEGGQNVIDRESTFISTEALSEGEDEVEEKEEEENEPLKSARVSLPDNPDALMQWLRGPDYNSDEYDTDLEEDFAPGKDILSVRNMV